MMAIIQRQVIQTCFYAQITHHHLVMDAYIYITTPGAYATLSTQTIIPSSKVIA